MADFHKYKFYYAGNQAYADGWERIFNAKNRAEDNQEGAVEKPRRRRQSDPHQKAQRSQSRKRKSTRRDNLPAQEPGRHDP